ncbi:protein kinase family protein [Pasteurellaceae bacterium LIM206]|nr:protein kinase family protein [Pasteurellaceae bacterium LIM206]
MNSSTQFEQYVSALFQAHRGKRVLRFEYEGNIFWMKQPEQLKGVWRILKPQPKRAFHAECDILRELNRRHAPVPELVLWNSDYFVLKDAGYTLNQWVENDSLHISDETKMQILVEGAKALADLHREGLAHGRPAIRDIAWKDHEVKFMDFESRSRSNNPEWQKIRDSLIFIHSLCRSKRLSDSQIAQVVAKYQSYCEPVLWRKVITFVQKARWIYYVLLPFKPIAKMDLIAIYRLFEILLINKGKSE